MFSGKLLNLKVEDILPKTTAPRKTFDQYELGLLAQSIKENGLIEPLIVRPAEKGKYILISGERRLKALKIAGLKKTPALVLKATDLSADIFAITENLQKQSLSFFEEAESIGRLIVTYNLTEAEAAEKLGVSESRILVKLSLLELSDKLKEQITVARLSERHALAVLKLPNRKRAEALNHIIAKGLTFTETEQFVYDILNPKPEPIRKCAISDHRLFENSLFKMVETLKQGGINASTALNETESGLNYIITIPKLK